MRPEAKVWRKAARRALRGVPRGRRSSHAADCAVPRPGSSWHRRHPDVSVLDCPCHHLGAEVNS